MSSGGLAGKPLEPSVLSEGFGMLRKLVGDLRAKGHQVTVPLDARISRLNPTLPADVVVPVFSIKEAETLITDAAKNDVASLIIAPETDRILLSLVQLTVGNQHSLNCNPDAIAHTSDKTILYAKLKNEGFAVPEAIKFDEDETIPGIRGAIGKNLDYPVIFKPSNGVSCGGVSLVKRSSQIESALAKVKAQSKKFIVQKLISGAAASVSLLCTGDKGLAISLNQQSVTLASPTENSRYEGGAVPFDHPLKHEAFITAERFAASLKGLRGYVGIDFVLGEEHPFIVDVNPRLTTSYVALSNVAGFSMAEAIINSALKNKLPEKPTTHGFAYFSKIETPAPNSCAFQKACQMEEVVSPPFPLDNNKKTFSLVLSSGNSCDTARLKFEEAKKQLLDIIR